jgi:tryptophan-rich sensory protein
LLPLPVVEAWRHARAPAERARIILLFAINGVLNVLWSGLFFRLHRPDWALAEVGFLWLSIVALIVALAPLSKTASWLLVPYLAWVTFAALLNRAVVQLNSPFA